VIAVFLQYGIEAYVHSQQYDDIEVAVEEEPGTLKIFFAGANLSSSN
jgi:hypothetical protein